MMRGALVIGTLLSLLWLPWPITAALTLSAALFVPLLPAAVGLLADVLYGAPHTVPLYALLGGACSLFAFFVRSQLKAGIIGE